MNRRVVLQLLSVETLMSMTMSFAEDKGIMKMIIAYIRTECFAQVMRELYKVGVGGVTCYRMHGI
ncbi:MAG TPA: hypothetical protein VMR88_12070 [Candidatus Polarisedimenticolaceae bacterium]|nr:hypothetical protein [Candidatus Polarisedimenticolaceae bacterium]